jgi:hypothetical protein
MCSNHKGRLRVRASPLPGQIGRVITTVRQVFERLPDAKSLAELPDLRFE